MVPGTGVAGSQGSASGGPQRGPSSQGPAGLGKRMPNRVKKRQHPIARVRGNWLPEEDEKLRSLVKSEGEQKWSMIAQYFPGRIGKQCRERWHYQLRPDISWEAWTNAEESKFIACHRKLGNKWAFIAKEIEGRTENAIKNHWNATLRRMDSDKGSTTELRDYMRSLDILPPKRKRKAPTFAFRSPCAISGRKAPSVLPRRTLGSASRGAPGSALRSPSALKRSVHWPADAPQGDHDGACKAPSGFSCSPSMQMRSMGLPAGTAQGDPDSACKAPGSLPCSPGVQRCSPRSIFSNRPGERYATCKAPSGNARSAACKALSVRHRSPCTDERSPRSTPSTLPGDCNSTAEAPSGSPLSPYTQKGSPHWPSGTLPGSRKRTVPAGTSVSSRAKKALLSQEDTWQAEGPKDNEAAPLHNLMPAEGPMDDEATLVHDLLPAEATWDDEAIPLQQNLMLAATSPRTQLQLMTQGSANSGATHITGGQGLPLHAPVLGMSCMEQLSDMDWSIFSGIDASLGTSPLQQALLNFHFSNILPTTPCSGFEMHAPLSSLGPPSALSIPPLWGLQDMSLAPMPLMPSLAPEVDLLSSCQEAMGMPGNPMAPASSRSANILGQGLGVDLFGGPFACAAADLPAATGFDLGPRQLSAGVWCPSPCSRGPARLATTWDEEVADSPHHKLMQEFDNEGLQLPEPLVATHNPITEASEMSGNDCNASDMQHFILHAHLGGHGKHAPQHVGMRGISGRLPRFPPDISRGESSSFFEAVPSQITDVKTGKRLSQ